MTRTFNKDDKYRPLVTIKKVKGKVPTVLHVSSRRYVYEPEDKRR
ncbi:hypothetical protein [Ornithinibacillus xuwenensis]|uniref:Transposase n=1 Tax=Ornithinibacillus xuwenensis TaxID=3144668 RepID=A0ABU9XC18_9BACI